MHATDSYQPRAFESTVNPSTSWSHHKRAEIDLEILTKLAPKVLLLVQLEIRLHDLILDDVTSLIATVYRNQII